MKITDIESREGITAEFVQIITEGLDKLYAYCPRMTMARIFDKIWTDDEEESNILEIDVFNDNGAGASFCIDLDNLEECQKNIPMAVYDILANVAKKVKLLRSQEQIDAILANLP